MCTACKHKLASKGPSTSTQLLQGRGKKARWSHSFLLFLHRRISLRVSVTRRNLLPYKHPRAGALLPRLADALPLCDAETWAKVFRGLCRISRSAPLALPVAQLLSALWKSQPLHFVQLWASEVLRKTVPVLRNEADFTSTQTACMIPNSGKHLAVYFRHPRL